jgi:hypothetical protein
MTFDVRARRSLERSRARRVTAWRARRRRFRLRGGALSLASTALAVAAIGAGAAAGQQQTAGSSGLVTQGSQGSEVAAVQRALGIPASGAFDSKTEAAVERFQRNEGLAVDGIVGPQTKAALGLGPAQPAATTPAQQSPGTAGNPALEAIAQCESGGNPQAVGGGGQYRGKYQFTRETWAAVGGTGDPAAAPEAEQDRRAAMLYAQSGPSQWPVCGG